MSKRHQDALAIQEGACNPPPRDALHRCLLDSDPRQFVSTNRFVANFEVGEFK
jgi:hypothetical protein